MNNNQSSKSSSEKFTFVLLIIAVIITGIFAWQQFKTSLPPSPVKNKPQLGKSNLSLTTRKLATSDCEELANNFDAKIDSIGPAECDKYAAEGNKPIWVGGKLINISKIYDRSYDRYEFTLTFQGSKKQGEICIGTKNESIPYEIGKFYRFDLENKCKLIYSMGSSGMFSDPNLDALEHLPECD